MEYTLYGINQRGWIISIHLFQAFVATATCIKANAVEELRSFIKWDVLDGIVEFPHEALLHVEAALFLLGEENATCIHAYT